MAFQPSNSQLDRAYDNYTVISSIDFSMNDFNLDFSSWKAGGEIEYLVFGAPVSQDYENSAVWHDTLPELK